MSAMTDDGVVTIPCPSGGSIEVKILKNPTGKRYAALSRVYEEDGEDVETEVIPVSFESLIASVKALTVATMVATAASYQEKGWTREKAEFEAVRQLPKSLYLYLPDGFGQSANVCTSEVTGDAD